VQKAAAQLAVEMPYAEAQTLCSDLTGVSLGSARLHTYTHQAAEGLTVLDVVPSRDAIERRLEAVAAGCLRRPAVGLGIDGAYVPTRPDSARRRRPGQSRCQARRALWRSQWREAKGLRLYLVAAERMVHLRWGLWDIARHQGTLSQCPPSARGRGGMR
jgi:hypothetical protein